MKWILLPKVGVAHARATIKFGLPRADVRRLLEYAQARNAGRHADEETYVNVLQTSATVRVNYADDILTEIEFLAGSLDWNGVELFATSWRTLAPKLKKLGQKTARKSDVGVDIPALGINIGYGDDIGADDDRIGWVYLGS